MAFMRVKDKNGNIKPILAIKGEDGKSAYKYAQEGGYTGTEEEFIQKLAEEFPEVLPNPNAITINGQTYDGSSVLKLDTKEFIVTVTDNGDGTYTSDYYFADIKAALDAGRTPVAVIGLNRYQLVYMGRIYTQGAKFRMQEGSIVTTINITNIKASVSRITLATLDDIPDVSTFNTDPFILITATEVNEDGTIPIIGYTIGETSVSTTSLEECMEAYLHGKKVLLQIMAGHLMNLSLPCTYCDGTEAYFEISAGYAGISAYVAEGIVTIEEFEFPNELPNPHSLTINGTDYDGSKEININTDFIVNVIDAPETQYGIKLDKTYAQIREASANKRVYLNYLDLMLPLIGYENFSLVFKYFYFDRQYRQLVDICIGITSSDNAVDNTTIYPLNNSYKNPYSLTINGTDYDGSAAIDMTNEINSMIDSKLGVIENGTY